MTNPYECMQLIEERCPTVYFWDESCKTFPSSAHGVFEDGCLFEFTVEGTTARLTVGEYDPESEEYVPQQQFTSVIKDCDCKKMTEYVDIFEKLVYSLDKNTVQPREKRE